MTSEKSPKERLIEAGYKIIRHDDTRVQVFGPNGGSWIREDEELPILANDLLGETND